MALPRLLAAARSRYPGHRCRPHQPGSARRLAQLAGGWELGLLVLMALLFSAARCDQSGFLRQRRRLSRGAARYRPLCRHGGRHDLRHRQQGSRSVGRLDLGAGRRRVLHRSSRPSFSTCGSARRVARLPRARHRSSASSTACWSPSSRAGLHRDADDAAHRSRHRSRPDRRQDRSAIAVKAAEFPGFFHLGETNAWASTTRSRSRSSCIASAPSCWPRPAGATRPSPPAATSRRRSMPASRRAGCASAPISSPRSARRWPA